MPWVKIDEHMPDHPKVIALSDKAFRLYVTSICYSSANKTDGEILPAALGRMGGTPKLAQELVSAILWDTTSRGGWCVHDYLKYNRSKVAIQAVSQTRREAGAKGAANRWQSATDLPKQTDGNLFLSASASGSHDSLNPARVIQVLPEPERQNDSNLPSEPEYPLRECMDLWTQATGTTVTRMVGDAMEAAMEDTPPDWVKDAIRETGFAGAKSWKYTAAILDRWKHEGREVEPSAPDPVSKYRDSSLLKNVSAWKEANG